MHTTEKNEGQRLLEPYPNEHAQRVEDPKRFIQDRIRRKEIAPGVWIITGPKIGGSGSYEVQAYRFDAKKFTAEQARQWLKDHDVVSRYAFEPATGE